MKFRLSQDGVEETFAINHLGKSYIFLPEICGVSVLSHIYFLRTLNSNLILSEGEGMH